MHHALGEGPGVPDCAATAGERHGGKPARRLPLSGYNRSASIARRHPPRQSRRAVLHRPATGTRRGAPSALRRPHPCQAPGDRLARDGPQGLLGTADGPAVPRPFGPAASSRIPHTASRLRFRSRPGAPVAGHRSFLGGLPHIFCSHPRTRIRRPPDRPFHP